MMVINESVEKTLTKYMLEREALRGVLNDFLEVAVSIADDLPPSPEAERFNDMIVVATKMLLKYNDENKNI